MRRANPLGIDTSAPRLSWKLQAANAAARGWSQCPIRFWLAKTAKGSCCAAKATFGTAAR